jgi:hypothetical protein
MDPEQLLAPLRDAAPSTPSRVNVHRAVHAGARRVWLRRAAAGAVAAVLTALAVVVVPSVVRDRAVIPPAGVGEFDIMRQVVTVGSAGGFTPVSYETGRDRQVVRLASAESPVATVTVYAPGRLGWTPDGEAAPSVNGHRAVWVPNADEVAWEWSPGAWAVASVSGGPEPRERAHRVALSVSPQDSAVSIPFTVAAWGELVGVIIPRDPAEGAMVLASGSDRVTVGVARDLTRDLASGQPRSVPPASVPLGSGFSAFADGTADPQTLGELAASVKLHTTK